MQEEEQEPHHVWDDKKQKKKHKLVADRGDEQRRNRGRLVVAAVEHVVAAGRTEPAPPPGVLAPAVSAQPKHLRKKTGKPRTACEQMLLDVVPTGPHAPRTVGWSFSNSRQIL
jgi:hypothetical protein